MTRADASVVACGLGRQDWNSPESSGLTSGNKCGHCANCVNIPVVSPYCFFVCLSVKKGTNNFARQKSLILGSELLFLTGCFRIFPLNVSVGFLQVLFLTQS